MKFSFSPNLVVDSEVEPWRSEGIRIGFYSAPGTRKSYTVAACIIEPFLEEGGTVVIFEPRSEWHTLKQRFESVVVAGGPFQDIPIAVNEASVYAEAIVKHGVSMVFDFTETEEEDLVRFAAELLARLFTLQNVVRRPLMLFFEELAEYCPFKTTGKLVKPWIYDRMKGRIVKIATQGRPLGFNLTFTSQRPAQLDFTVRMMANISFYGKFHPKDLTDIEEVLSAYKDIPITTLARECVRMPHGSWIAITFEKPQSISIDTKRTTPHGADTPKIEYEAPKSEQTKQTMQQLTETITEALEKERREESELQKLQQRFKTLLDQYEKLGKEYEQLKLQAETLGKIKIELPEKKTVDITFIDKVRSETAKELKEKVMTIFDAYTPSFPMEKTTETGDIYKTWEPKLPSLCAKRILKFLLDNEGMKYTKSQLGVSLGYKTSSGTFNGALSFLRQNNLIKSDGRFVWCE